MSEPIGWTDTKNSVDLPDPKEAKISVGGLSLVNIQRPKTRAVKLPTRNLHVDKSPRKSELTIISPPAPAAMTSALPQHPASRMSIAPGRHEIPGTDDEQSLLKH